MLSIRILGTQIQRCFSGGSDGKESACNAGDPGSIPELGRSPKEGHGNPLQYSCLENPHGQRSLAGYSPWGHKELDMNVQLTFLLSDAKRKKEVQSGRRHLNRLSRSRVSRVERKPREKASGPAKSECRREGSDLENPSPKNKI